MRESNNQKNENLDNSKKEPIKIKKGYIILAIVLLILIGIIVYSFISKDDNCDLNKENTSSYVPNSNSSIISTILDSTDVKKPIIYLYPEEQINISVKLGKEENITCSYPEYKDGWNVIAHPDGTLVDIETGRNLYALYWEGIHSETSDCSTGFVVKGSDSIKFLEEKLAILGLTDRESNEFIMYWLPNLQENEYNYIRFATMDEINKNMPLEFSIKPDTLIRVCMEFKALDKYIEIPEQKLETPSRDGFVVVEWGGTEIK